MMPNTILKIQNLSKAYGNIKAVQDISFEVYEGELFAFLGPNGAGKSTTINMLSTLLSKDQGSVFIDGNELGLADESIRTCIGIVFQGSFLDALLTVKENLFTRGRLYHIPPLELNRRILELSTQLSLSEFIDRPYGNLSGGQKRRVDIARALINHPKILFLDEPTTGLDPQTRFNIWSYIDELRQKHHMTIFLTTHYMEEANRCDRVCIIDHGQILEMKTPSELKVKYAPTLLKLKTSKPMEDRLKALNVPYQKTQDGYELVLKQSLDALDILNSIQADIDQFEVLEGSMDTVFLALTGQSIREDSL